MYNIGDLYFSSNNTIYVVVGSTTDVDSGYSVGLKYKVYISNELSSGFGIFHESVIKHIAPPEQWICCKS